MADRKRESNVTSAGYGAVDASVAPGSSGLAPTDNSDDSLTREPGRGQSTGVADATPTTAEEAMDNAEAEDGFVDESAYTPTDR